MPGLRAAARCLPCRHSILRRLRRLGCFQIIFMIIVCVVILHEVLQNRSQRQWASFIEKEAEWNKFEKASDLKQSSETHKSSRKTPRKKLKNDGGDIFKKHREYVKTSSTTKSTS